MNAQVHREVIEPARGWSLPDVRALWEQRDLVYFLVKRDVTVRYKQAIIGAAWTIVQPLLLAIVFAVFLGAIADMPAPAGVPYALFALSGMTVWLLFATSLQRTSESLHLNVELISKVYFPRIVLPVAAAVPAVIDFAIALLVVVVVAAAYGFWPDWPLLFVPAAAALAVVTSLGLGLWLSALYVKYHDIQYLVAFLLLVGMFVSPIVYPFALVPDGVEPLYALNPMVGVLEGFRWAVLGTEFPGIVLLIPVAVAIVVLATGLVYFARAEREFADVI